jgi:hypothetical protein
MPNSPIQIFSKIHRDIRKSRCTTGVNDTGGNFTPAANLPWQNLPPLSMILVANLPPLSTILAILRLVSTSGKIATSVVDTGGAP